MGRPFMFAAAVPATVFATTCLETFQLNDRSGQIVDTCALQKLL
jgi:hypothetical protein